jgi:hypothetical protein
MATKKEFYVRGVCGSRVLSDTYALGYFHGRTVGVYEARLFNGYLRKWGEPEAHLFKQGYDSGVADYCEWEACEKLTKASWVLSMNTVNLIRTESGVKHEQR